jgi:hypothetical protein
MKAVRTSIFLALVAIAAFASIAHAYPMNAFDTKTGAYTTVQVAVAGNYINGKIYNPAAYVKAVIDKNLPSPYCLVVYYYFEWEDLNHVVHYQYDTVDCPGYTTAGQWVRFFATGLPSQVYYIVAEGRAGYDGVWDTDMASISVPFR